MLIRLFILISLFSYSSFAAEFFSFQSMECQKSLQSFAKASAEGIWKIGYGQNSYSGEFKDYKTFRDVMLSIRPSIHNFLRRYELEFGPKKRPTFGDVLSFYFESHQKLKEHLTSALGHNTEIDNLILVTINGIRPHERKLKAYQSLIDDKDKILGKKFNLSHPRQKKIIDSLGTNIYKGFLGEFDMAMRLDNVFALNVTAANRYDMDPNAREFSDLINSRIKAAVKRVSSYSNRALVTKYPNLFKGDPTLSRKEFINGAIEFLKSKEFDIIIKENGTYRIVEVKNLKQPLQVSQVSNTLKKKDILDQIREDKEILEFLGLEKEVHLSLGLLRGITDKARDMLNQEKIRIYSDLLVEEEIY